MVNRVYHLDRGSERLEEKLSACGAMIERISELVTRLFVPASDALPAGFMQTDSGPDRPRSRMKTCRFFPLESGIMAEKVVGDLRPRLERCTREPVRSVRAFRLLMEAEPGF